MLLDNMHCAIIDTMKTQLIQKQMFDILADYFKNKNYSFVVLFGSYNSGSFSELSDIDIGIYFTGKVNYMDMGYDAVQLESALEKKVDIVVLNDLYKKDALFAFKILENHSPLVVHQQKVYIDFKKKSQLYYLDREKLLEMNTKNLQGRIEKNRIGERNFARAD